MQRGPQAWPIRQRLLWALLTALVCFFVLPHFLANLHPPRTLIQDFYQEWASARNFFGSRPVYTRHEVTAPIYVDYHDDPDKLIIRVNAHPPTSVLLALPFAFLDHSDAFLAWALLSLAALALSLWIVVRQLGIRFTAWSLLPLVTLLLICSPFRQHMNQGQINLILLPLITGAWAAERSGRPGWAGVFLGLATAIKLFPGFLFVYYLLRGRWKVLWAGALSFLAVTGLTVAVLGVGTYHEYVVNVLPEVGHFRDFWLNASLPGLWSKLFDAPHNDEIPLMHSPELEAALTALSCLAVLAVFTWVVWRARSPAEYDVTFGLALVAMLLVSPITWDHYFLLLLVPLAVLWVRLPDGPWWRLGFAAILVAIWIAPKTVWQVIPESVLGFDPNDPRHALTRGRRATPFETLAVLSYLCYTLLGLFVMLTLLARRERARALAGGNGISLPARSARDGTSAPAPRAADRFSVGSRTEGAG
jgi:hypothetical protein